MVVLVVTWVALKDRDDEVASIFSKLAVEARKEPGCLMFVAQRHRTDRARFLIYEQYRDDAALEAHRVTPHFKDYVRNRLPSVAVRVEGELYEPLP